MRLSIPPSFLPAHSSEPSFIAWSRNGLPCFIRRQETGLHLCGYVGVPSTHPWFTSHHDDLPAHIHAAAHGGLTYTGVESGFNFFGFDCAHSGDRCPGHVTSSGTYRDLAYVTAKVNALADALYADAREAAPQLRDALEAALDALEAAASQCGYIDNRRQPDDDVTYTCEAQTQRDLHDAAKAARQALESLA